MMLSQLTPEQKALAVSTLAASLFLISPKWIQSWLARVGSFTFRKSGDKRGIKLCNIWIPDEARLRHTHIVGATGSGKTVLLEQLILQDIERGYGALIIDPKGDREFFERIQAFCKKIGRENDLKLLSATHHMESSLWNPCRLGTSTELQSKFYNSAIYSEPHYAKACELALLKSFNELTADQKNGFSTEDLVASLKTLSREGRDETISGLFLDLYNLVLGPWGKILARSSTDPRPEVDLLKITRAGEILFVDLPTESQAVQSARIGRLLLQEIILVSGLRKLHPHLRNGKPFSVFVDEFDAFAFPSFATFLNKGRSSEFMIHLAHQTLSDLDKIDPTFRGQIVGNMNVRFIFRQDDPDDAESWSRFFGTHQTRKRTFQVKGGMETGVSSVREVQEFRVHPDSIKELRTGRCYFGMKSEAIFKELQIPFEGNNHKPRLSHPMLRSPLSATPTPRPKQTLTENVQKKARVLSNFKTEKENTT